MDKRTNETRQNIIKFIDDYMSDPDNHGRSPSRREIAEGVGLSAHSVVSYHLAKLRATGQIDWLDGKPVSVWLVKQTGEVADAKKN